MLTELYFKGMISEYRRVFKCVNELIKQHYEVSKEAPRAPAAFETALEALVDYIRAYGEKIFWILARGYREDIHMDYEVTLRDQDRYEFLKPQVRKQIYLYLVKDFFEAKCIAYLNQVFKELKHSQ